MAEEKIRVVIADDHPALRAGVRNLLEKSTDIIVIGEAGDGQQAVDAVENLHPDVLLLDIQMPILDGIQVINTLQSKKLKVAVIVLSAVDDLYLIAESISKGASGYYLKEDAPLILMDGIRKVVRGDQKGISPQLPQHGLAF